MISPASTLPARSVSAPGSRRPQYSSSVRHVLLLWHPTHETVVHCMLATSSNPLFIIVCAVVSVIAAHVARSPQPSLDFKVCLLGMRANIQQTGTRNVLSHQLQLSSAVPVASRP
jgi:hypothetical protein